MRWRGNFLLKIILALPSLQIPVHNFLNKNVMTAHFFVNGYYISDPRTFIVLAMGVKPSPSDDAFRFFC